MWHPAWHGWLEFKGARTALTAKQRIVLRRLNERVPGSAYVVRYPDRIENERGDLLATFDEPGQLLEALRGNCPE